MSGLRGYSLPARVKESDFYPWKSSWGAAFIILTEAGIKKEGEALPSRPKRTQSEAWSSFQNELSRLLKESKATQLEWRTRPQLERPAKRGFRIYSLLAVR